MCKGIARKTEAALEEIFPRGNLIGDDEELRADMLLLLTHHFQSAITEEQVPLIKILKAEIGNGDAALVFGRPPPCTIEDEQCKSCGGHVVDSGKQKEKVGKYLYCTNLSCSRGQWRAWQKENQ